jgi:hypothetical protein
MSEARQRLREWPWVTYALLHEAHVPFLVAHSEFGTIPGQAWDKAWNGPGSRPGHVWNGANKHQNRDASGNRPATSVADVQCPPTGPASSGPGVSSDREP